MTTGVPGASQTAYGRVGVRLMVAGVAAELVGLGLDAWLHVRDAGLAHREALFTFSNPGHAVLIVGTGVALFGAFLYVTAGWLGRLSSHRLQRAVPTSVAMALVLVAVVASQSSLGRHPNVALTSAGHTHDATESNTTPTDALTTHSHGGEPVNAGPLDPATQALLDKQLQTARSVGLRYPHLSDAVKSGWTRALEYGPGIGAHYMRYQQTFLPFDVAHPAMLLYSGDNPDSVVVAVVYYVYHTPGPPDGFAGHLEEWHQHPQTCVGPQGAMFSGDPEGFRACGRRGRDAWMLHVWCVPGWENVLGTFAYENPKLP